MTDNEPGHRIRAVVDRDECFGFANCVATLPAVFVIDEEGISRARDVDADAALLDEAVEGCPRNAISLEWRAAAGVSSERRSGGAPSSRP